MVSGERESTVSQNTMLLTLETPGGKTKIFYFLRRKSDMTVTIACSEPGVYQVLVQNRGKSYFHRIKSLCVSPFREHLCVSLFLHVNFL